VRPVVAFDVDGTLLDEDGWPRWDVRSVLIAMLSWCTIVVWSGSGADYAAMQGRRLFLPNGVLYREKETGIADICFDDQDVTLAAINVYVGSR
jgi:hypothetical protein